MTAGMELKRSRSRLFAYLTFSMTIVIILAVVWFRNS